MQKNHVENLIMEVSNKDKSMISSPPDNAFKSTATVQFAMLSLNSGSIVRWDVEKKQISSNPEVTELLSKPYRYGYIYPWERVKLIHND